MAKELTQGRFAAAAGGTVRGWSALPRFRHHTSTGELEYFFGARFQKTPSVWMLWNGEEWSLLKEESFLDEFQPSNKEARDLLVKYDLRSPNQSDLDAVAKSIENHIPLKSKTGG